MAVSAISGVGLGDGLGLEDVAVVAVAAWWLAAAFGALPQAVSTSAAAGSMSHARIILGPFWGRTSGAAGAAGIQGAWSPRELRHSFVSLMSDSGVPVEEIARLARHTSTRTTEIVYRHQLRPVKEKGAQAMDQLFGRTA